MMKHVLLSVTILSGLMLANPVLADSNNGGYSMSKRCSATNAGAGTGGVVGGRVGWLVGGATCAASVVAVPATGGASLMTAIPYCGAAIVGAAVGAKTGEKVGQLIDGDGCE